MSSQCLSFGITAIRHDFSIPLSPERSLPRWVHSFVLHRDGWIAVDAGVRGAASAILDATNGELSTLLLTHSHADHLGGALSLCQQTGCLLAASAHERSWIETPEVQLEARPIPGFWQLVEGGVALGAPLEDGARAPTESSPLQVVATPGHSPGHLAFWDAEHRVLFAGDAIPVAKDMPIYDDASAMVRSLERFQALGPIHLLLSAWDEPYEGAQAQAAITRGLDVVHTVQRCVGEVQRQLGPDADLTAMTRGVAQALGLPAQLAGPLLARTVRAHQQHPICE